MKHKFVLSLLVILMIICCFVGCSSEAPESIPKNFNNALEALRTQTTSHTTEVITFSYSDGDMVQEITRWYSDGNCLYHCNQAHITEFDYFSYDDILYLKVPGTENWITAATDIDLTPAHLNWDTSASRIISWEEMDNGIQVVCDNMPENDFTTGSMTYVSSTITYYFDEKWNLKQYETHSVLSGQPESDTTETMTTTISVSLENTADDEILAKIDNAYMQVEASNITG